MNRSARDGAKQAAGWLLSRSLPQCRYRNALLVLAHMRCGSTALSNILCTRADVSGYGEAHVRHDGQAALGRLALNHMRRGGWSPRAGLLFDKILHSRHDGAAPPAFFDARAIFVVRRPGDTVRSIVTLYRELGRDEYGDQAKAAAYYVERLGALEQLWRRFPPAHRIGLTHEALLSDPEAALARISDRFGLFPPLENRYVSAAASRRGGGGDPLVSGRHTRIEPRAREPLDPDPPLDVPDSLADLARDRYTRLAALFAQAELANGAAPRVECTARAEAAE